MTNIIQKYLSYLRYEKNYSLHTEISYSKDLCQFEEYLNQLPEKVELVDVDADIVRQWMSSLIDSGVVARSVNRKLSSLKSFYRYLLRVGIIQKSPMKGVVGPRAKKPLPSFANNSDLEIILDSEAGEDEFSLIRDRAILEVFYMTGIRRAELINLKLNDVDFGVGLIKVTGKRNKQRLIPFADNLKLVLESYLAYREQLEFLSCDNFFVRKSGEPMYPVLVYRIVRRYLESIATLDKSSPHVLRHSFATNMLNNGAEINAVKELLGHSSLASTEVYTHTSFEELKKIYKKAHPRA